MVNWVLTDRLPGSVAVTITVETPGTLGVPLMIPLAKDRPVGKPATVRTRALGVWASVKVLAVTV